MSGPSAGRTWLLVGFCLLVAGWIAWLRQPALTTPIWNVDEAITATIGDEILAGGVPFRDATDLRAPLTYYFYAAVFVVAGRNNMGAVHVAHTGLVIATALLVLLLGRRSGGNSAAGWSVWIYAGLACCLFHPLDNLALHTEWPLAFCSALGATLYLAGCRRRHIGWFVGAGSCYGLAVLSKQPALLDLGAPLALQALLFLLPSHDPAAGMRRPWRETLGLLLGLGLPLALTVGYFAACGALQDFIYYTWTYNTRYYVPEVPLAQRFPTVKVPLELLHSFATSLLVMLGVSLLATLRRLFRWWKQPGREDVAAQLLAPLWLLCSLGATTLSGRGFEHYSIQLLVPASLVAGQLLGPITDWAAAGLRQQGWRRVPAGLVSAALVAIVAVQLRHGIVYRAAIEPHRDPAVAMAKVVREVTTRQDRIFVWGFYSDLHTLSDRLPASRFVHGAFLTGLIPWTNLGRDTSYAVVPGSMETLLADLEKSQPRLIVDASPSLNRKFQDYPPEKFPAFLAYLRQHYIEYEPQRSEPRGWFHFYLRRDAAANPADPAPAGPAPAGTLVSLDVDFSGNAKVAIQGSDAAGRLTQLGLLVGNDDLHVVSFPPTGERMVVVPVSYPGAEIRIVARTADGRHTVSAPLPRPDLIAIPAFISLQTTQGNIAADGLSSPFPPGPVELDGEKGWLCHAYTALRFPLPASGRRLQLSYGISAGAYEHPGTGTDGVEFIAQLQRRDGSVVVLHRRFLNPVEIPADRGRQSCVLLLPTHQDSDHLVLITHPGPAYRQSYDWSYWLVPRLETGDAAGSRR